MKISLPHQIARFREYWQLGYQAEEDEEEVMAENGRVS